MVGENPRQDPGKVTAQPGLREVRGRGGFWMRHISAAERVW